MLLSSLLQNSGLEYRSLCKHYANTEISEIFCDSRCVVRNGLYVALEGLHTDSHAYLHEAISHGACAAVVSRGATADGRVDVSGVNIPIIEVQDCREALSRLYAAYYGNPQREMTFVGVTGTNGKTTVCRMIFEILSRSGRVCGLIGTSGNYVSDPALSKEGKPFFEELSVKPRSPFANMTTPDPPELYKILAEMRSRGVGCVIMEVTSHSLALSKVAPIDFEVGVFTNLTEDHLDFHRDMEDYFSAKKILFGRCRHSVVNIDDAYGRRLKSELVESCISCSAQSRDAYYNACDVRTGGDGGVEYKLVSGKMRVRIRSKIPGMMTVMNTMQSAAVCALLGVSGREIKDSIAYLGGIKGRLERLKLDERVDFSVYIDYAHTPDALENLLRTARMIARRGSRVVLLFGCGGDRERQKRPIMGRIASGMADFFVITSDNSRSEKSSDIIGEIISGVTDEAHYTVIEDREEAIEYLIKNARCGDIILLAGKGHEEYQIDADGRRPFSEREIVCRCVTKYYG